LPWGICRRPISGGSCGKETTLALTIGLANGLVMATIAYLWKGQALLLKSFRVDPAIALSVIITTFTDVFGFFSFLALATLLIRFLL
jgi:magnesium transporter